MTTIRLMLAGDVMTGRGIDQILAHPLDPVLYEDAVKSALNYVELAEAAGRAIPRSVSDSYVWGDMIRQVAALSPDLRIVNLETAVTTSGHPWPKGINYRMHPANVGVLTAAAIDCCVLANNHVLDWGHDGLRETLRTLTKTGIATVGAGRDKASTNPTLLTIPGKASIRIHAYALASSGVPPDWAGGEERPGVAWVDDNDSRDIEVMLDSLREQRPGRALTIVSLHWGSNWGYAIDPRHRRLAHRLIDAGADLVFGHSSHHPKAIELHHGKLILYGCGDFLNDYEGIPAHEGLRSDLALAYLPELEVGTGRLVGLRMLPFRIQRFQLMSANAGDRAALIGLLNRECGAFGLQVTASPDGSLLLMDAGRPTGQRDLGA